MGQAPIGAGPSGQKLPCVEQEFETTPAPDPPLPPIDFCSAPTEVPHEACPKFYSRLPRAIAKQWRVVAGRSR